MNNPEPIGTTGKFSGLFGLPVVYQLSGRGAGNKVHITKNDYRAENSPFFGYSGSIYMSFLIKGLQS